MSSGPRSRQVRWQTSEAQVICHCHRLASSHSFDFLMIWIWRIASKCTSTHWPTVAFPTRVGMLCASQTEWSYSHTPKLTHFRTYAVNAQPLHAHIPTCCTCSCKSSHIYLSWTLLHQRDTPAVLTRSLVQTHAKGLSRLMLHHLQPCWIRTPLPHPCPHKPSLKSLYPRYAVTIKGSRLN